MTLTGVVLQLKAMSQVLYCTVRGPSACAFGMVHEPEKFGELLRLTMFKEFSTMLATAFASVAAAAAGTMAEENAPAAGWAAGIVGGGLSTTTCQFSGLEFPA